MKKTFFALLTMIVLSSCSSFQRTVTQSPTTVYGEYSTKEALSYVGTMSIDVKSRFHTQGELLSMARKKFGDAVTIDNIRIDRKVTTLFVFLTLSNNDINVTFDVVKK